MKVRNVGKFTVSFGKFTILWEYFHGNRYYGKIPMDIWHYALRCGESGKNCSNIQRSWWSSGLRGRLLSQGLSVQILQNILRNLVAKFPSEHGNC
jgi:hypothetical protein